MIARFDFLKSLSPHRLHVRIALLGGALLALVTVVHTAYTVVRQTDVETEALQNQAQSLTNQIAISAAALLVTRRYSEIEELLTGTAELPDVQRLQVVDVRGRVFSDVVHGEGGAAHPVFEIDNIALPEGNRAQLEHRDTRLVVWQPIQAGGPIGWVRLSYSLERVSAMRRRIIWDGAGAALLAVAASFVLFAWLLARPMRAVARATAFAGALDERRGEPFAVERGAVEIEQLGEALNRLSQRLAEQERAISSVNRRLSAILQHAIDGIVAIDEDGTIESANPAAERMFGMAPGELVGQSFNVLVPDFLLSEDAHHDADPPLANDAVGTEVQANGRRHDGSVFPLVVGLRQMELEGRRLYVGMLRDITQQQRLDRMKENFIESVSHELRTPLTALHGSLELLATDNFDGLHGQVKGLVAMAYKNSGRLVRLVNDILDFEDIEAGRLALDMQTIDVVELLREATSAHQWAADEQGVRLTFHSTLTAAWAMADPARLRQAFAALLVYSIRMSPAGQPVHVGLRRMEERLELAVTNRGPGIPPEVQPYLFRKFVQVDASSARYKSSADVGLGLAKTIIEHLGGTVRVTSEPPVATTFFVEIPEVEVYQMPRAGSGRPTGK